MQTENSNRNLPKNNCIMQTENSNRNLFQIYIVLGKLKLIKTENSNRNLSIMQK